MSLTLRAGRAHALALLVLFGGIHGAAQAATPASGTLVPGQALTFGGGPFVAPNPSSNVTGQTGDGLPVCTAPQSCDDYALTINASSLGATRVVQVRVSWPLDRADFDVYLLDSTGKQAHEPAATSFDPEVLQFPIPADGTRYTIRVVPFNPAGQSYTAQVSLVIPPPAIGEDHGVVPEFLQYTAPGSLGNNAGEPSFGIDWLVKAPELRHDAVNTGGVGFFQSGANTLRVSFDDATSPASAAWQDVSTVFVQQFVLSDPIGFTDPVTGRVFSLDLIGGQGNSLMAYSDDDGKTWNPAQGGGVLAGPDHQTLGTGPFPAGFALPHTYARATYYCSQADAQATCSLSIDGGRTFLPAVPIYRPDQCAIGGIHGHVKVAPDSGTVYVPTGSCFATPGGPVPGSAAVAVSEDAGQTWNVYAVPGSSTSADPSIGIGRQGAVYMTWIEADGSTHAAVSHDHGHTWVNNFEISQAAGIRNSNFVVAVAGDDDRAAVGFLGTPTAGDANAAATFRGVWHFYIATTYDGGLSWILVDATPSDPVQVGSICTSGTTCGTDRNLLDFNDATVDREGRILMGFADGCLPPGCTATTVGKHGAPYNESRADKAAVIRQTGGRRLIATFDPVLSGAPAAPRLDTVLRSGFGDVTVAWTAPVDTGASALTGYNIYRGTSARGETLLTTVGAGKPSYLDRAADPVTTYYYQVSAINAQGESIRSGELVLAAAATWPEDNRCVLPGASVSDDPTGDEVGAPANSALDVTRVQIAEPFTTATDRSLTFMLSLGDTHGTPAPQPNSIWKVEWDSLDTNGNSHTFWVSFDTTFYPTGAFNWGYTDPTTAGLPTDQGECNQDPVTGACPELTGNYDGANNRIVFKLKTAGTFHYAKASGSKLSDFDAKFGAGTQMSAIGGNTQLLVGAAGTGGLAQIDSSGAGNFRVRGNSYCRPNTPPLAALDGTPDVGDLPLTVTFSGAASSDADADAIATYLVDFGDGSDPVESNQPTVTHSYTVAGNYPARLLVTDERGLASVNLAQKVITARDANPDAFTFTSRTGVTSATLQISGEVTLSGFSGALPVTVAGGRYALNGGAPTNVAGVARAGDRVKLYQVASFDAQTAATTTLTVGAVSGSFTTTTGNFDADPDAFTIPTALRVPAGTLVESAAVTPTGYDTPTRVAIVGGSCCEVSVNGGAWSAGSLLIKPGQSLRVRHVSASAPATIVRSIIRMGNVRVVFSSRTAP